MRQHGPAQDQHRVTDGVDRLDLYPLADEEEQTRHAEGDGQQERGEPEDAQEDVRDAGADGADQVRGATRVRGRPVGEQIRGVERREREQHAQGHRERCNAEDLALEGLGLPVVGSAARGNGAAVATISLAARRSGRFAVIGGGRIFGVNMRHWTPSTYSVVRMHRLSHM
jgi:hypothetical protein